MLILKDALLRKKIIKTAMPCIFEMVLYMMVGVVDVLIVGRLGPAPLAAVSLGAQIFFAITLVVAALGVGSSILVAQAKGSRKQEMVDRVASETVMVALALGITAGIIALTFSKNILQVFALEPDVFDLTLTYLRIVFYIIPMSIAFNILNGLLRGMGRTDLPMKVALIGNLINCIGDYVFVYGKLGFPQFGVAGAAYATSLAHIVGFLIVIYILLSGNAGIHIKGSFLLKFQFKTLKSMFKLGLPTLGEQFSVTMANILSSFLIIFLGTVAFASHQIAISLESISFMPGYGISIAAVAMVGHAVGAGNNRSAQRIARGCLELTCLLMGAVGLLFALFPYKLAAGFSPDWPVIAVAGELLFIAAFEQIPMAISLTLGGILKGAGNTRAPMIITILFICCFRFPLMFFMIHHWHLSIIHIWLLFVIDWILRSISYAIVYHYTTLPRHAIVSTVPNK